MKGLIFTYLMTFGGALAALFNPFVGLLVYVCFAIVRPQFLWSYALPPGGNYSRIVAMGLLAGWVLKGCGSWRFGQARAMVVALGGFGLWAAAAMQFAIDQLLARMMVEELIKIIVPVIVGITLIDSVRQLRILAWVMVLSQGYLALEFNLDYFAGYNRLWLEGYGSLDNNGNAVALVACVGMAFFLGLNAGHWALRGLAAALGLLMVHAILFSFSRGGMLSLMITGMVAFLLVPKRPAVLAAFALAGLAVVRMAGPQVVERFQMTFITERGVESSADSRLTQWSAALKSIAQTPLGVGPDQWKLLSSRFNLPEGQAAHSTWLQVGAELGLPGLGCLLLFYFVCIARLLPLARGRAAAEDPWVGHLARMVITSLTGFVIAAQFVSLHKLEIPYFVALIGAGLLKLAPPPAAAAPPVSYGSPYAVAGMPAGPPAGGHRL